MRILDLAGGTGSWSAPYALDNYEVDIIDPIMLGQDETNSNVYRIHKTVQEFLLEIIDDPPRYHGVLFAPPCTHLCGSGAKHWKKKDEDGRTSEAVDIVKSGLYIIELVNPNWFAIENPVGRMRKLIPEVGDPLLTFDPSDYGDPYKKRTQLFGKFNPNLKKNPGEFVTKYQKDSDPIHRMPPGPYREMLRSKTPPGFVKAFKEANP